MYQGFLSKYILLIPSASTLAPNGFQLYAVVVFVVLKYTIVQKLTKDILFKINRSATIAYKLLLAAGCEKFGVRICKVCFTFGSSTTNV
jgi:hypothetical protein